MVTFTPKSFGEYTDRWSFVAAAVEKMVKAGSPSAYKL